LVAGVGFEPTTLKFKEHPRRQNRRKKTHTTQLSDTNTRKKG